MKTLTYNGNFDLNLLSKQLLDKFPQWREVFPGNVIIEHFGMNYDASTLNLFIPDDADTLMVDSVIVMHDATASKPIDWPEIIAAKNFWLSLPNWATWSKEQAQDYITNQIFSGWTQAQVDAWIDANVTTLATAKTAMKQMSAEILDIRDIMGKMAYLLMLLRTIVVKRSNL